MTKKQFQIRPYIQGLKPDYSQHFTVQGHDFAEGISPIGYNLKDIRVGNAHIYRNGQDVELIDTLSRKFGVSQEDIGITKGCFGAIKHFIQVADIHNPLIPAPSFIYAKICDSLNIGYTQIRQKKLFCDLNEITTQANKNSCDAIFIANPVTPTGEFISEKKIRKFIQNNDKRIIFMDQALSYLPHHDLGHLVEEYNNLVVGISFSKQYGLAALRKGAMFGPKELIETFHIDPFNVSAHSVEAAKAVLNDEEFILRNREIVRQGFEHIRTNSPFPISNSESCVFTIDAEDYNMNLHQELLDKGIITVPVSEFGVDRNAVRCSVKNVEKMQLVIDALIEIQENSEIKK